MSEYYEKIKSANPVKPFFKNPINQELFQDISNPKSKLKSLEDTKKNKEEEIISKIVTPENVTNEGVISKKSTNSIPHKPILSRKNLLWFILCIVVVFWLITEIFRYLNS